MKLFFKPLITIWLRARSFTDSTHLKANANKHKYTRKTIEQDTQNYINELEEAIQEDRVAHGKSP